MCFWVFILYMRDLTFPGELQNGGDKMNISEQNHFWSGFWEEQFWWNFEMRGNNIHFEFSVWSLNQQTIWIEVNLWSRQFQMHYSSKGVILSGVSLTHFTLMMIHEFWHTWRSAQSRMALHIRKALWQGLVGLRALKRRRKFVPIWKRSSNVRCLLYRWTSTLEALHVRSQEAFRSFCLKCPFCVFAVPFATACITHISFRRCQQFENLKNALAMSGHVGPWLPGNKQHCFSICGCSLSCYCLSFQMKQWMLNKSKRKAFTNLLTLVINRWTLIDISGWLCLICSAQIWFMKFDLFRIDWLVICHIHVR